MPDMEHRDRCDIDDRLTAYSGLSKAARVEEWEDLWLTLGKDPDPNPLLVGLSDSERHAVLEDLKLCRLFLVIGRAYRKKRAPSADSSLL